MEKLVTILGITVSISTIISFIVNLRNMQVETKNKAIDMCLELNNEVLMPLSRYSVNDIIEARLKINNSEKENRIEEYIRKIDSFCVAIKETYYKCDELIEKICGGYLRRNGESLIAYRYIKNTIDSGPYSEIPNIGRVFTVIDKKIELNENQRKQAKNASDYKPIEIYAKAAKDIKKYWLTEDINKIANEKDISKLINGLNNWKKDFYCYEKLENIIDESKALANGLNIYDEIRNKYSVDNKYNKNELKSYNDVLDEIENFVINMQNNNSNNKSIKISELTSLIHECKKLVK